METEKPIMHFHVKILTVEKRGDEIWVKVLYPTHKTSWMPFPAKQGKPQVGWSGTVYALKPDSVPGRMFQQLINEGATNEQIDRFIKLVAEQYDEFCTIPFDQVQEGYEEQERRAGRKLPAQDEEMWNDFMKGLTSLLPKNLKDSSIFGFTDKGQLVDVRDGGLQLLFGDKEIKFH